MNKLMTVGLAALMAAGVASAQVMVQQPPANDDSVPQITAEAALMSAYVWRGQVYNNDFVVQPQLTISQYDISFNIWANYDLIDNFIGINNDFSEIDFTLAYTLPVDINEVTFDIGLIHYNFPANAEIGGVPVGFNAQSTTELFATATVQSFRDLPIPVIPSLTLFGDVDEADGVYFLLDVVVPYDVSDELAVEGGIKVGYGNTTYNDYYFGDNQDAGLNDINFYGNASYAIADNLTASANLTYTMLEGGSIRDAADQIYESDQKLWCGVNIAYDF